MHTFFKPQSSNFSSLTEGMHTLGWELSRYPFSMVSSIDLLDLFTYLFHYKSRNSRSALLVPFDIMLVLVVSILTTSKSTNTGSRSAAIFEFFDTLFIKPF